MEGCFMFQWEGGFFLRWEGFIFKWKAIGFGRRVFEKNHKMEVGAPPPMSPHYGKPWCVCVCVCLCMCVCVVCQEKQLDTEEGSLECKQIANLKKSSAIAFSFTRVFHFLMIFLLFVLASVVANHKAATEADVLNKIAGILKYAPDKIGAGGRGKTGDNDK